MSFFHKKMSQNVWATNMPFGPVTNVLLAQIFFSGTGNWYPMYLYSWYPMYLYNWYPIYLYNWHPIYLHNWYPINKM